MGNMGGTDNQQKDKSMKLKRFTKPGFLKSIGRQLLGQFFDRFGDDLAANNVAMPAQELDDDAYFNLMSRVAMSPDGLPDNLIEAIYAVEAMANEEGQERLERAAQQAGLPLTLSENSSQADIAVQLWMADPALFAQKVNEQRLVRLSSFEYFGSATPMDRRESFVPPNEVTIARITGDMDTWFQQHNRGEQTAHIEVYPMDGEFWFLVRHGDTFTRMPTAVANRCVQVLHFRPTKDDVVVYSPLRDEIRIHTGTKGERELYQATFGQRLLGNDEYFSRRKAYTLEPLRTDGVSSLDTDGLPGISRIVLREIEMAWDGGHNEVLIRKADDIFGAAAEQNPPRNAVPQSGRLVRAAFDFYFGDCSKPRKVQIRVPNILKLGRHCDAALVHQWISARGFRVTISSSSPTSGNTYVEPVAVP